MKIFNGQRWEFNDFNHFIAEIKNDKIVVIQNIYGVWSIGSKFSTSVIELGKGWTYLDGQDRPA